MKPTKDTKDGFSIKQIRCEQCALENNMGICDKKYCANYTPKETWEKRFLREFVNTHNETWRPLRGLWVEDVLAFIAKELDLAKADMWSEADAHEVASDAYKQGKAEGAREVIEAVFQQIATMDGIKCEQERDIFRLLATLREDYKEKV